MILYYLIIPFVCFFFFGTSPHLSISQTTSLNKSGDHLVYLIKQNWHTAIVLSCSELNPDLFRELNSFKKYELIDIGWGDEEFYQSPGFDSGLAYKALFYKTPGALRVEGIDISKEAYFELSEIVVELTLTDSQFRNLCSYINNTFRLDDDEEVLVLSKRNGGKITFYKANGEYYLFNTCNTWLAKGLKQAGLQIENDIILTEELFRAVAEIGNVIKAD